MEHLDFVLWMVLFPISWQLSTYLTLKNREMRGIEIQPYSDSVDTSMAFTEFILWVVFGIILF